MTILPITLNKYILHDNHAELILVHERIGEIVTLIDLEDVEKCRNISWVYNAQTGYVQALHNQKRLILQRFLMSTPEDKMTDHKNGDKLDNRKDNLRFVTPLQSQMNTKKIGVNYRKDLEKYRAYIKANGKHIALGVFDTYEEACKAREEAEIKYFGEFRRTSKFDFLK
jgi:hypothetical protein